MSYFSRTRETDDAFNYDPTNSIDGTTFHGYYGHNVNSLPNHYSIINDVVGNRHGINPMTHKSFDSTASRFSNFMFNGSLLTTNMYVLKETLFDINQTGLKTLSPDPSVANVTELGVDAFNKFHDQIPAETSLANFLYELRDIKGMIPKMERSITKTVSGNFLGYEFGIKPFISDIKKFISVADTVNKRLQYLRDTLGKTVPLSHSGKILNQGPTDLITWDALPGGWPGVYLTARLLNHTGTARFGAKLHQNLEGLSDLLSVPKGIAAALGLNNPAAIVWEAIPYSFVVDWFFHLQSRLNALAVQPFGGEWSLSDVCWSSKQEWLYEVIQDCSAAGTSGKIHLGFWRIVSYGRELGLPVSASFATSGLLTPKQQLLSLALIEQRRH